MADDRSSSDDIGTGEIKQKLAKRSRSRSKSESHGLYRSGKRTVYTAGKPPWFDSQGQLKEAFIIGICGGSASGKTTVATNIIDELDIPWVCLLSMDCFYKVLTPAQHEMALNNEFNFDHPDAFDINLMTETLKQLKAGKSVQVPQYDFTQHGRLKDWKTLYGANVIIFEGILTFYDKNVRDLLDMKIFVDIDSDIRLARRLQRDTAERGRDIMGVLKQYNQYVKPSFDSYIAPCMCYADIVVPRGGENQVALDLIVRHIHNQLESRGTSIRAELAASQINQPLPNSLHILSPTPHIRFLHTRVRNTTTSGDDLVFYSKGLIRLLIECALSFLPFQDVTVDTPQGIVYEGKKFDCHKLCSVSIVRAGETLEPAIQEVWKDIKIGKILIQTNPATMEPELHYLRLPKDISDCHVLVLESTVATGAAAIMAIRVLLDHYVPEENIMLLSILMAESGVHSVAYAFPKVRIITTSVDEALDENFYIVPGMGNFGDRYFGTGPVRADSNR